MTRRIIRHTFTLLNVDYVSLGENWNYQNILSPYYRMYYIDQGLGYASDQYHSWKLEPGYMYLIPCFTLCTLRCPEHMGQYFIHFFEDALDGISLFHNRRAIVRVKASPLDVAGFKRLLDINPFRKINRSDNPKVYEKNIYYQEYEELNNKQGYEIFMETSGILIQLVAKFLGPKQSQPVDVTGVPAKVVDLLGYIQLNLSQPLTVNRLAAIVNLHPDYLSRLFLRLTGERPLAYIHSRRIERAQYLMVTTDQSLGQICQATGFDTLPHFIKVFKKVTSLTPGQYREQHHSML
ncbi:MAG: helix-turn-helix transcriptional regulator [Niastella sp.]|nr:helix-turn-helix transcriptional regulator [Niastella sp.]